MKKELKIVVMLVSFGFSSVTDAASQGLEKSIYGLTLGAPFIFSECTISPAAKLEPVGRVISPDVKYVLTPAGSPPCFQHRLNESTANPVIDDESVVRVVWPCNGFPEISSSKSISALILKGEIHRVWIFTRGLKFQDYDMGLLSGKFGKPTKRDVRVLQNGFGAVFESVSARWDFGDSSLVYEATADDINSGIMVLETSAGSAAYKARLLRRQNPGPKM